MARRSCRDIRGIYVHEGDGIRWRSLQLLQHFRALLVVFQFVGIPQLFVLRF